MVPFRRLEGINYDKSTGQDDTCFSNTAMERAEASEKAFSHNLAVSVISILFCIVALCSITYAWFTEESTSGGNTLTAATFSLDVSVNPADASLQAQALDGGRIGYTLTGAGTYEIALTLTDTSTATKGFCDVKIDGQDAAWQTEVVYKDEANGSRQCVFKITTTQEETVLLFTPKWGLPAESELYNGCEYTVIEGKITQNQVSYESN